MEVIDIEELYRDPFYVSVKSYRNHKGKVQHLLRVNRLLKSGKWINSSIVIPEGAVDIVSSMLIKSKLFRSTML